MEVVGSGLIVNIVSEEYELLIKMYIVYGLMILFVVLVFLVVIWLCIVILKVIDVFMKKKGYVIEIRSFGVFGGDEIRKKLF